MYCTLCMIHTAAAISADARMATTASSSTAKKGFSAMYFTLCMMHTEAAISAEARRAHSQRAAATAEAFPHGAHAAGGMAEEGVF